MSLQKDGLSLRDYNIFTNQHSYNIPFQCKAFRNQENSFQIVHKTSGNEYFGPQNLSEIKIFGRMECPKFFTFNVCLLQPRIDH